MTDHMPDCAALRCQNCGKPENSHFEWEPRPCAFPEDDRSSKSTTRWKPGCCNCELGRLRADNERLREIIRKNENNAGDGFALGAEGEDKRAENVALRAEVERRNAAIIELRDAHSAKCKELEEVHEAWDETSTALVEQVDYTETLREWQRRARAWMVNAGPGTQPSIIGNLESYSHQCVLFEQERKELIAEARQTETDK